jgi:hypothetical protein
VEYAREYPMKNTIRLPKTPWYITNELLYRVFFFIYNVLPALLYELIAKLFKLKSLKLLSLTRQSIIGFSVLSDFAKGGIEYDDKNLSQVVSTMTEEDSKIFPCTIRLPIVNDFNKNVVLGMQKYLMKETKKDLKKARRKMRILIVVDWIMNAVLIGAAYWMLKIFVLTN